MTFIFRRIARCVHGLRVWRFGWITLYWIEQFPGNSHSTWILFAFYVTNIVTFANCNHHKVVAMQRKFGFGFAVTHPGIFNATNTVLFFLEKVIRVQADNPFVIEARNPTYPSLDIRIVCDLLPKKNIFVRRYNSIIKQWTDLPDTESESGILFIANASLYWSPFIVGHATRLLPRWRIWINS